MTVTAVEKMSFAAFESAGEGIVITDLAGNIQYANPVFEKISGYRRDDLIGQNPRILKSGKHPASFYQRLWQTLGRGDVWRGAFVNRRKDGTTYHSEQTIAPVRTSTGQSIGYVSIHEDVSARVRFDEQRRTRELQNVRDAADERVRLGRHDLELARQVQNRLFPRTAPEIPGFDLAGSVLPAEETCGDYYDFMEMSDAAGDRRLGITVADVAGHGIVAALTMTSVRVLLRSHAGDGAVLKPVIRAVNRHLAADATAGRFVTLVYLVIEPDTREVRWINAGHGSLLLYDPGADSFEEIEGADIPLGVEADWNFHERLRSSWPASAILAIGTDGIWETHNPEGKAFGGARFREVIRTAAQLPAEQICAALVRRLKAFADGTPQRDDVTLVIIKFPTEI